MAETSTPRRSVLLRGASVLAGSWLAVRTGAVVGLGALIEACSAPARANKYGGPPPEPEPAKYGGPVEPEAPHESPGGAEKYGGPPGGPAEVDVPELQDMAKKRRPKPAKYGGPPPPKPAPPKPKYGGPPQPDKYGGPPIQVKYGGPIDMDNQ
ncbi:MAG: hypothetical protein HY902_07195 [Deltaproteobacteria bacterium]|nr:hypothetical protein [Deltaproteobacteria bacterium]